MFIDAVTSALAQKYINNVWREAREKVGERRDHYETLGNETKSQGGRRPYTGQKLN